MSSEVDLDLVDTEEVAVVSMADIEITKRAEPRELKEKKEMMENSTIM